MTKERTKNGLVTRERILQTALKLFNKMGYYGVRMRDIAGELNISPGNLTYHFNKKEDLLVALLDMQYEDYKETGYSSEVTLEELNAQFERMIAHRRKYYFYFYNITSLPRKHPLVSKRLIRVKDELYNLLRNTFDNFVKMGVMKEEPREGAYDDLGYAVLSIMMYWIQQNSLEDDYIAVKKDVLSVIWNIIIPNIKDEGDVARILSKLQEEAS